jgi:hypothetical protein
MNLDGIFVEFEMEVFDGLVRRLTNDRRNGFMWEIVRDVCIVGICHSCDAGLTVRLAVMREG